MLSSRTQMYFMRLKYYVQEADKDKARAQKAGEEVYLS